MTIDALLRAKDYAGADKELAAAALVDLARAWAGWRTLERLVAFKLLDPSRALELYALLPFELKYELLAGFPLQSIAPVLEELSPLERRRFAALPREFYERMFRLLVEERAGTGA